MSLIPENNMERILNGEDVTPSCRAEYFVKQAIANASSGGGGDEYETVAEIAVGTMEERGSGYIIPDFDSPFSDNLQSGDEIFLEAGSEKYPLEIIRDGEGCLTGLWYNWNDDIGPTGIPVFVLEYNVDDSVFEKFLSSENLSNTTVRILKKVSGGETITVDSELDADSENPVQNKVIAEALEMVKEALEMAEPIVLDIEMVSQSSGRITNATAVEIAAAWNNNVPVYVVTNGARLTLVNCVYVDDENYRFKLNASIPNASDGSLSVYQMDFNNSLTGDIAAYTYAESNP